MALITLTETLWLVAALLFLLFWGYTLYRISNGRLAGNSKLLWMLVVLLLSPVGLVIYYTLGVSKAPYGQ